MNMNISNHILVYINEKENRRIGECENERMNE